MCEKPIHVVKLGGSLLDLPDLPGRWNRFVHGCTGMRRVLIIGGGPVADVVRTYDTTYRLGEETGHWLAVRAMQFNSYLVKALLGLGRMVVNPAECRRAWQHDETAMVDPLGWLECEYAHGRFTPHRWSFTSDSIAAHIACGLGAHRLTLLKSKLPPPSSDVPMAAASGIVDVDFPAASSGLASIRIVNLRAQPPTCCELRWPEPDVGPGP